MVVITVDFTNVETGAGFLEPGVYRAQVEAVREQEGRNYPGLKFTWASIEPETEGQRADMFVSLAPQSLWRFKQVIEALGGRVPQSIVRVDTDRLVGKRAVIRVVHEPWTDSEGVQRYSSKVDAVHALKEGVQPVQGPMPADIDEVSDVDEIPF